MLYSSILVSYSQIQGSFLPLLPCSPSVSLSLSIPYRSINRSIYLSNLLHTHTHTRLVSTHTCTFLSCLKIKIWARRDGTLSKALASKVNWNSQNPHKARHNNSVSSQKLRDQLTDLMYTEVNNKETLFQTRKKAVFYPLFNGMHVHTQHTYQKD